MAFCDWLTLYQVHPEGGLPRINDGAVWAVDSDGVIDWTTEKKLTHVGSYDTKIRIKCDGSRVTLDGNISRFGRPDNVFGYSVRQCIHRANALLAQFGLPPFTAPRVSMDGDSPIVGGAIITRVDLTENYATGSERNALRLVNYLAGQDAGRRATVKQYGYNGVTWNEGSKYWYSKLYLKAESIGEHATESLQDWVRKQGIARHEISLKARYLAQNNLRHITNWEQDELGRTADMDNVIYNRFAEVLTRGTAVHTPLEHIPGRLGDLALAWRAGKNVWADANYSPRTKRAWRKALLPYGIDIKQQSNAVRLNTRVEVITLEQAQAPAWYWDQQRAA